MSVIVFGPSFARRPKGGWAAPNAMNTFPIDDAWIGILLPTQLPAPSGWLLLTWATRATPLGVGIATFVVSPVALPSRSRNGQRESRQVADARVAARVLDEHGPGSEATAAAALCEAVPLESAQKTGGCRLR